MANWCYTSYVVVGDANNILDLYRKLLSLLEVPSPLIPNEYGCSWVGNLIALLGGQNKEIFCRGLFSDVELEDSSILRFSVLSAWAELFEVRNFIEDYYGNIKMYFYAEEPGCNYYLTNDADGVFFKDRYIINTSDGVYTFVTLAEVYSFVGKLTGKRKHSVNHVFLSPTSIINFTSKKQSYDDTRRSSRDNELLQRAQSDL